MKALIVDNDPSDRAGLILLLGNHCPEVKTVLEAGGVKEARQRLADFQPDILFVDLEMDDGTGLDLVRGLRGIPYQVIFITAYNQYAVNAFRLSAVDYLLKPIVPEELREAVWRAQHNIHLNQQQAIHALREHLDSRHQDDPRIALREQDAIHLVRKSEILYCQADGVYTVIAMTGGRRLFISRNLKEYEELLGSRGFLRVHHSYLANMAKVISFKRQDGGFLILEDGTEIPVSQRKREVVMDYFKQF